MAVRGRGMRRGKRSGQGLVELALAMPVMLLLLLGTIDLGRLYFDYVALKSGARSGARYGVLKPFDTAGIQSRVLNSGVPAGTTVTSTCQGNCTTVGGTGQVVVTTKSTFTPITLSFFTRMGVSGKVTLSVTATMRVLS